MGLSIAVTPGEVMDGTNVSEQSPIEQALSRASDSSVHKARAKRKLEEHPDFSFSHAIDT
jgi:hypothetical protein